MKASEWACDRMKEAFELVAQDETENMSIVQEIMLRSTDYLWRIVGKAGGQGGQHVLPVPALQQFPSGRPHLGGLWGKDHKVVVRNLSRKVRLEATEQAFGRTNGEQF